MRSRVGLGLLLGWCYEGREGEWADLGGGGTHRRRQYTERR